MADAGTFVVEATLALFMAISLSGSVQPLSSLQWLNWRQCKDLSAYQALLRKFISHTGLLPPAVNIIGLRSWHHPRVEPS